MRSTQRPDHEQRAVSARYVTRLQAASGAFAWRPAGRPDLDGTSTAVRVIAETSGRCLAMVLDYITDHLAEPASAR